jgi:hypothetical protein
MTDLQLLTRTLRVALRIAGKRIVQLNFGRKDDRVLIFLQSVLRETKPKAGGGERIRTSEPRKGLTVFETAAIDQLCHPSATTPV